MSTIVNAAPMTNMLGVQDLSSRVLPPVQEALPTHLPKVYLYTKKGPLTPQLVSGAEMTKMYGIDSFDLRKKWSNHSTVFANVINAQGNAMMVQRVKPDDAAAPASFTLFLDVLETDIPVYQRNTDGSYKTDTNGAPLPVTGGTTVPGYKIMWVAEQIPLDVDGNVMFGQATQKPGSQTAGTTQSLRYPIMDLTVSDFGSYGNDIGLRLWAPTSASSQPINPSLINNIQAYPFSIACVSRADSSSSPTVVETQYGEQNLNVTFKPNAIDTLTDSQVSIGDVFIQSYQLLNKPGYVNQYGPFGQLHLYQANILELVTKFYAAELPHITGFSDITGTVANEEYVVNFISAVSSHNVPYVSLVMGTGTGAIRLTPNTTVYALGGADGTMSDVAFGASVATLVAEYGNPNSVLQDTATYPESIMYDSGFPLATKYAMTQFISVRKDTAVILSTYDAAGAILSASQDSSLAIALRTHLQMFPESEFYGTATMRGMIVGRSGTMLNSQYSKPLPLTIEIGNKAAKYMGAGNGIWKSGKAFDCAPNNIVNMFTDISVTFTPASVRNKDWANGLVWVDKFDRRNSYFPALKTVYDDDTSVLNSFFTMMACVECEKVGERARRQFSGVSSLTNAQLVEKVNDFIIENTLGRFDGRFVIKPVTYFTAADVARGYSWTTNIQIYAPNMKTVMTLTIQSYRISDLPAA